MIKQLFLSNTDAVSEIVGRSSILVPSMGLDKDNNRITLTKIISLWLCD